MCKLFCRVRGGGGGVGDQEDRDNVFQDDFSREGEGGRGQTREDSVQDPKSRGGSGRKSSHEEKSHQERHSTSSDGGTGNRRGWEDRGRGGRGRYRRDHNSQGEDERDGGGYKGRGGRSQGDDEYREGGYSKGRGGCSQGDEDYRESGYSRGRGGSRNRDEDYGGGGYNRGRGNSRNQGDEEYGRGRGGGRGRRGDGYGGAGRGARRRGRGGYGKCVFEYPAVCDVVCAGDYGGEHGDRREEDRPRSGAGDVESARKPAPPPSNAWSKGKPSSLGPQKPIILKRRVEEEAPVGKGDTGALANISLATNLGCPLPCRESSVVQHNYCRYSRLLQNLVFF